MLCRCTAGGARGTCQRSCCSSECGAGSRLGWHQAPLGVLVFWLVWPHLCTPCTRWYGPLKQGFALPTCVHLCLQATLPCIMDPLWGAVRLRTFLLSCSRQLCCALLLGAAASLELHAWPPSPPSNAACSFCQGRVSIVVSQCPYGFFAIDGCPCALLRRGRGCACVCALVGERKGPRLALPLPASQPFSRWYGSMWSCFSGRA